MGDHSIRRVIQGFEIRRSTNVGTAEGEDGRGDVARRQGHRESGVKSWQGAR